jgi:hypothetical protein
MFGKHWHMTAIYKHQEFHHAHENSLGPILHITGQHGTACWLSMQCVAIEAAYLPSIQQAQQDSSLSELLFFFRLLYNIWSDVSDQAWQHHSISDDIPMDCRCKPSKGCHNSFQALFTCCVF